MSRTSFRSEMETGSFKTERLTKNQTGMGKKNIYKFSTILRMGSNKLSGSNSNFDVLSHK